VGYNIVPTDRIVSRIYVISKKEVKIDASIEQILPVLSSLQEPPAERSYDEILIIDDYVESFRLRSYLQTFAK